MVCTISNNLQLTMLALQILISCNTTWLSCFLDYFTLI